MIEVTVNIGEAVIVNINSDVTYSPDIADDLATRAKDTALDLYHDVISHEHEP